MHPSLSSSFPCHLLLFLRSSLSASPRLGFTVNYPSARLPAGRSCRVQQSRSFCTSRSPLPFRHMLGCLSRTPTVYPTATRKYTPAHLLAPSIQNGNHVSTVIHVFESCMPLQSEFGTGHVQELLTQREELLSTTFPS